MKKIVAIVALLGIMLQTFNQVVIVAEYYAQKDYIAKNLCENRNKPQMHCDGKCCLKKKLAREGKEQAPAPGNQKQETVTLFFSNPAYNIAAVFPADVSQQHISYNEGGLSGHYPAIFHPPAA